MGLFNKKKGLLTGLMGTVVFVNGKDGKTIVRSRPTRAPRSLSAKKQQSCSVFSLVITFIKPMYPFVKESFTHLLGKNTARDAVRSYTRLHAVKMQEGIPVIEYARVLISTGSTRPYQALSHQLEDNNLQLCWVPDTQQAFAEADDLLTVVVYLPQQNNAVFFKACAPRIAGEFTLQLPDACAQAEFHVWATFANAAQDVYAFSTYLGSF